MGTTLVSVWHKLGGRMCGIAGKLYADGARAIDARTVDTMTDAMVHRGPDARGTWIDGAVGLGHRRLSIIDLSPDANQPMVGRSGAVITFNGEIYNFATLRAELAAEGHRFRTRGDTEVLLALYERRGERCVDDLIGMFAFAIWDPARQRLFCARDRLGKKPFYYYAGRGTFSFASEAAALLADPDVPVEMDPGAIHHYLTLHYVPSPQTAYVGVCKLPPAHTLTWQRGGGGGCGDGGGRVTVQRYWRASFQPKHDRSIDELADELWHLVREATRIRLFSDVPLGAFLSGGTDSSTVVAAMREVMSNGGAGGTIETFSIGFHESEFNELAHAAEAARRYGTRHHELLVTPDAATALPELVAHHGEPFSDPSSIPTYYLARMTRARVTVALSGDGGDEAFGGYARYVWAWIAGLFDEWPREIVSLLARLARFAGGLARAPRALRIAGQYVTDAIAPDDERYLSMAGHFPPWERQALYTADFRGALLGRPDTPEWFKSTLRGGDARAPLDRYIENDLQGYLADGIMAKVDIASMTHSLEVRAPLLDHRIIEFGARLPTDLKQRGLQKRVLFKRAARDHLPPATLTRRKRGFGIPVAVWLRGPLRPMLDDLVLGPRLAARGIFTASALRRLCDEHQSQRADHGHKLWNLMVLELWARRFLDTRRASAALSRERPSAVA